ncbi:MAG: metallophosphoesterase [Acidimicrobiia bacterium]
MLIVSDVHGAHDALAKVAASTDTLLVLGDLINFTDYRTSEGIVADVVGVAIVAEISELRARGEKARASEVWSAAIAGRKAEVRHQVSELMAAEYEDVCAALAGTKAYVTYGNVDRPDMLKQHLGEGARFVDAETLEIEGRVVGFAGGGMPRIGTPGEVTPDDMAAKLDSLGPVDILCTHVPPDVPALAADVIGRTTKGSPEILEYLIEYQPAFHYFGDIHQPRAITWQVGRTRCINVGYFRATGRAVRHD